MKKINLYSTSLYSPKTISAFLLRKQPIFIKTHLASGELPLLRRRLDISLRKTHLQKKFYPESHVTELLAEFAQIIGSQNYDTLLLTDKRHLPLIVGKLKFCPSVWPL